MTDETGSELGARLEEHVASIFRALDYIVVRDRLLNGHQVDLLATRIVAGYGEVRLVIEVKYRTSGPVPKSEVVAFLNIAETLIAAGQCTRALMVSNRPFTRFSYDAIAHSPNIRLQTVDDVERSFLSLEAPLARFVQAYRSPEVRRIYVDLGVTFLESEPPSTHVASMPATELLDAAVSDPAGAVVLFADFGAGKSTALERIKARAAQDWLAKASARIPVLFLLKDYSDTDTLDRYVSETFLREYGSLIPPRVFWELLDNGRFVILLDGFDEITLGADAEARADLLRRLSPLLFGASPAILTTRPSYFVSYEEYRTSLSNLRSAAGLHIGPPDRDLGHIPGPQRLADRLRPRYAGAAGNDVSRARDARYVAYSLNLLTSVQIDELLDAYRKDFSDIGISSPTEVRQFIDSVYDLSDLTQRPILLDMVVTTILEREINIRGSSDALGPTDLYEAYTGLKLTHDWDKSTSRRASLEPEHRRRFAEICAWHLHTSGLSGVDNAAVAVAAAQVAPPTVPIESVLTDLRTCSFLTISEDGSLRFVHKSFLEFFVARRLKANLEYGRYEGLGFYAAPEVLYFLGSYGHNDDRFRRKLKALTRSAHDGLLSGVDSGELRSRAKSNLCAALSYARSGVHDVHWTDVQVIGFRKRALHFSYSELKNVLFKQASVTQAALIGCAVDLQLDSSCLERMEIVDCRGAVNTTEASSVVVENSQLKLALDGGRIDRFIELRSLASDIGLSLTPRAARLDVEVQDSTLAARGSVTSLHLRSIRSSVDLVQVNVEHVALTSRESLVRLRAGERKDWFGGAVESSVLFVDGGPQISESTRRLSYDESALKSSVVFVEPTVNVEFLKDACAGNVLLLGGYIDNENVLDMDGYQGLTFVGAGHLRGLQKRAGEARYVRHGDRPRVIVNSAGTLLLLLANDLRAVEVIETVAAAIGLARQSSERGFPQAEIVSMWDHIEAACPEFGRWQGFRESFIRSAIALWPRPVQRSAPRVGRPSKN